MSLRLILTRHAKSSWDDPMMDDHDRPLNKRGRRSAKAIGKWLVDKDYLPDAALVSSAERTRETWGIIAETLGEAAPEPAILPELFHAEPEPMLGLLRAAQGRSVMLIGHNPGMVFFARALIATPPPDVRFERYPTAATTIIDFDLDEWHQVGWRAGRAVDFIVPRDLID